MSQRPHPRHSVVLNPLEVAWAGGLFEGEGSITPQSRGTVKPKLQMQVTDLDSLERFHNAIGGLGTLSGPTVCRPRSQHKPVWTWTCSSMRSFLQGLEMLWPYIGERRKARAIELVGLSDWPDYMLGEVEGFLKEHTWD